MEQNLEKLKMKASAGSNADTVPPQMRHFMTQYFRHNPELAPKVDNGTESVILLFRGGEQAVPTKKTSMKVVNRFIIRSKNHQDAFRLWDGFNDAQKEEAVEAYGGTVENGLKKDAGTYDGYFKAIKDGSTPKGYRLYRWDKKAKQYMRISTLGGHGITEYDFENKSWVGVSSMLPKNNSGLDLTTYKDTSPSSRTFQNRFQNESATEAEKIERHEDFLLDIIQSNDDSLDMDNLKHMAQYVYDNIGVADGLDIVVNNSLGAKGAYDPATNIIHINEFELGKHSGRERARTILEEYIHAITNKGLTAKAKTLTKNQLAARNRIKQTTNELRTHLDNTINPKTGKTLLQDLTENMDKGFITDEQRAFDYAGWDAFEFLAAALLEPKVVDYLMERDRIHNTNFVERIMNLLSEFLSLLGIENRDNRYAEVLEDFFVLSYNVKPTEFKKDDGKLELLPTSETEEEVSQEHGEDAEAVNTTEEKEVKVPDTKEPEVLQKKVSKTLTDMPNELRDIFRNMSPIIKTKCN